MISIEGLFRKNTNTDTNITFQTDTVIDDRYKWKKNRWLNDSFILYKNNPSPWSYKDNILYGPEMFTDSWREIFDRNLQLILPLNIILSGGARFTALAYKPSMEAQADILCSTYPMDLLFNLRKAFHIPSPILNIFRTSKFVSISSIYYIPIIGMEGLYPAHYLRVNRNHGRDNESWTSFLFTFIPILYTARNILIKKCASSEWNPEDPYVDEVCYNLCILIHCLSTRRITSEYLVEVEDEPESEDEPIKSYKLDGTNFESTLLSPNYIADEIGFPDKELQNDVLSLYNSYGFFPWIYFVKRFDESNKRTKEEIQTFLNEGIYSTKKNLNVLLYDLYKIKSSPINELFDFSPTPVEDDDEQIEDEQKTRALQIINEFINI